MDRAEVGRILTERLDKARKRREIASADFDAATKGPSEQLDKASHEYTEALTELAKAVKAHNDFVVNGRVPEDLG